jgi:hypothetical protein
MPLDGEAFDPEEEDPYEVLGVNRAASAAEIREAWVALIKHTHSDRVGDVLPDEAKRINAAYVLLRDPQRRRRWDKSHPHNQHAPRRRPTGVGSAPPLRRRPAARSAASSHNSDRLAPRAAAATAASWRYVRRTTRVVVTWMLQPWALRLGSNEWVESLAVRVGTLGAAVVLVWLSLPFAIVAVRSVLHLVLTVVIFLVGLFLILVGLRLSAWGSSRRGR